MGAVKNKPKAIICNIIGHFKWLNCPHTCPRIAETHPDSQIRSLIIQSVASVEKIMDFLCQGGADALDLHQLIDRGATDFTP